MKCWVYLCDGSMLEFTYCSWQRAYMHTTQYGVQFKLFIEDASKDSLMCFGQAMHDEPSVGVYWKTVDLLAERIEFDNGGVFVFGKRKPVEESSTCKGKLK